MFRGQSSLEWRGVTIFLEPEWYTACGPAYRGHEMKSQMR
jgi:hypothetical protein